MSFKHKQMKKVENALQGKPKAFFIWGCSFVAIGFVLNIIQTKYDFSGIISSSKFLFFLAGISEIAIFILKRFRGEEEREEKEDETK